MPVHLFVCVCLPRSFCLPSTFHSIENMLVHVFLTTCVIIILIKEKSSKPMIPLTTVAKCMYQLLVRTPL